MPTVSIPLAGVPNQRNVNASSFSSKDQRFIAATFTRLVNPLSGKVTVYVEKRPGIKSRSAITTSIQGTAVKKVTAGGQYYGFYDTAVTGTGVLYDNGGNLYGNTDSGDVITHITEVSRSGTTYIMVATYHGGSATGGYYLSTVNAVWSGSNTFTADTTSGNANLTNVSSTAGLLIGQKLSGTGIASGARITNISGSTVTMNLNATANGSTITITRDRMAKIMASGFPTTPSGPFIDMDGFLFIADLANKQIVHSDINSITSWTSINVLGVDPAGGKLFGLAKLQNSIYAMMASGVEMFVNAGNPVGSTLNRVKGSFSSVGVVAPYSYCELVDKIYQIDAHGGVHERVGPTTKKISSTSVERIIQSNSVGNICGIHWAGKPTLVVANKYPSSAAPDYSYFYDVENEMWSETGFGLTVRLDSQYETNLTWGVAYDTTGKDLYFDFINPTYQDNAVSYTMTVQTSRITHESDNRKFVRKIRLVSDNQSSGTVTLEASDDDYANWVTLGTFDLTVNKKEITRCGSYKGGRAYRLTHSSNTPLRAQAIEIDYELAPQ